MHYHWIVAAPASVQKNATVSWYVNRHDDIMQLLISLGAEVNTGILASYAQYAREDQKQSILDWVNVAIQAIEVET